MKNIGTIICLMIIYICAAGCSHTINKREPDKNDPNDQGSETEFQVRGPRVVLQHKF